MILQSKRYDPERAASVGLVDEVVSEHILIEAASDLVRRLRQRRNGERMGQDVAISAFRQIPPCSFLWKIIH